MSDNHVILIPEDPRFVPDEDAIQHARELFVQIAPDADEVDVVYYDRIQFFDCGENFEKVSCPSCGRELEIREWHRLMDEDYQNGFKLDKYDMPCCNAAHTVHELVYDWPMGCGRFGLCARNRGIGMLDSDLVDRFQAILGTRLRVIYKHI